MAYKKFVIDKLSSIAVFEEGQLIEENIFYIQSEQDGLKFTFLDKNYNIQERRFHCHSLPPFLKKYDVHQIIALKTYHQRILNFLYEEKIAEADRLIVNRLLITPKWRNSGITPTKEMKISVAWTATASEEPSPFPVSANSCQSQFLFAGPKSTVLSERLEISSGVCVHGGRVSDLYKHKILRSNIFVWGKVEYEDIFGGKHISESCYKMNFILGDGGYKITTINYIQCGTQNSAA